MRSHSLRTLAYLFLALAMLLSLFAGCQKQETPDPAQAQALTGKVKTPQDGEKTEDPEPSQPQDGGSKQEDKPILGSKPSLPQKPNGDNGGGDEPAPDAAEWVGLTGAELEKINESLDYADNGFFLSSYSRPEEIDWHEVFYNGAGVGAEVTDEMYDEIEDEVGELYTDVTVIALDAVRDFMERKTGIPSVWARIPLWFRWDYLDLDGESYLYFMHGDTNMQPIRITSGTRCGSEYFLRYTRSDWQNFIDSRPFVMHCVIENGTWRYISNLPDDAPPPVDLLDIEYFETKEEAQKGHIILEYFTEEQTDADEPSGYCWCVLTAKTDDVYFTIDRGGLANTELSWDMYAPEQTIEYGILYEGESVAIYINRPWYPTLRITAKLYDRYYGEFWVGEDNYLHLEDDVPRYIVGHDLQGEGRGCDPVNEVQLVNFLQDGDWCVYDEEGEITAVVSFRDYRSMYISSYVGWFDVQLDYDRLDARPTEAPDLLVMRRGWDEYAAWDALPEWFGDALGDYLIYSVQLDGEQVLVLSQANNGDGALGDMLGVTGYDFTLCRYKGTTEFEAQG